MSAPYEEAGEAGWTLIQLAEQIRRVEELLLDGLTLAGPHLHAGMPRDATLALTATDVRRIVAALAEGVEIAEQVEQLAAQVSEAEIDVGYEAVRDAAAADLAHGIADPHRAQLAARMLDVGHGWPALADGLAASEAVATWGRLTVEELLASFRGADRAVVRDLLAGAGLAPGTRFADCSPDRLAVLADGLRRRASGQPAV